MSKNYRSRKKETFCKAKLTREEKILKKIIHSLQCGKTYCYFSKEDLKWMKEQEQIKAIEINREKRRKELEEQKRKNEIGRT